jgi:hypothetical protein
MNAKEALDQPHCQLFLRAVCCLIAADKRVRSAELSLLSRELQSRGIDHTEAVLRDRVVRLCKQIHAVGATRYTQELLPELSVLRGTRLAPALSWYLWNFAKSDGPRQPEEVAIQEMLNRGLGSGTDEEPSDVRKRERMFLRLSNWLDRFSSEQIASVVTGGLSLVFILVPLIALYRSGVIGLMAPGLATVPKIEVRGCTSCVTFGRWTRKLGTLESVMTYNRGEIFGIDFTAFGRNGVKLDEGKVSHVSLKKGETGAVEFHVDRIEEAKLIRIVVVALDKFADDNYPSEDERKNRR